MAQSSQSCTNHRTWQIQANTIPDGFINSTENDNYYRASTLGDEIVITRSKSQHQGK